MDFTILIRTFTDRFSYATRLKTICDLYLNARGGCTLVNTQDQKEFYSQAFCVCLASILPSVKTKYILILEDDMLISNKVNPYLQNIMRFDIPCVWLSIFNERMFNSSSVLNSSLRYLKTNGTGIHYSGAILLKTSFLKDYLSFYFLNHLALEETTFDVSFSKYLEKELGFIPLKEGFFATSQDIPSSLQGRKNVQNRYECNAQDPHFDFRNYYI